MDSEEYNTIERFDDVVLPGFRFHPTDEELVGFYLKRKVLQKSLPFELIKKVDIYKYDPWDLPKLASMGEKEWYFYCPRDRKYRNSTRPNRVTGGGFWKATGTDRPIYSLDATKCIGLKKSLVFYRGRAAKGVKTDWMMHEFRLPSLSDSHHSSYHNFNNKKQQHNNTIKEVPSSDGWAICRIFKKVNSVSSQRSSVPQSWMSGTNIPLSNQYSLGVGTGGNVMYSAEEESSGFTGAAAAYFASQMLGVPYSTGRSSGTGDVLLLNNNNEQNYFNNMVEEIPDVRSGFAVETTAAHCASEMSATSYSTNN